MNAALGLRHAQTQTQSLSPAMWMGLNMLAMPVADLKNEVRKELDSNPALKEVSPDGFYRLGRPSGIEKSILENIADSREETLEEHLLRELKDSMVEGRDFDLCVLVIRELDENGRFVGSVPDLVMVSGASASEIENARQKVMRLDPLGCGAKDLQECFLAQIDLVAKEKREMFRKELESLGTGKVSAQMVSVIKKLDPFPGRLYSSRKADYVNADIIVDEDGTVEVDNSDIPRLSLSPDYELKAKNRNCSQEERQYAAEQVKRAREFIAALDRRMETLESIAQLAVNGQRGYLERGRAALVRLTMSEVARAAKCNVATVSRAAARKYVKTPRGTVPLRFFFRRVDEAPICKLEEILNVPANKTLSDREISLLMKKSGFNMARRTVAKYRARVLHSRQDGDAKKCTK